MTDKRTKHPWAVRLSEALHAWLKQHRSAYEHDKDFADQLGIPKPTWADIIGGYRITKPETYAKIFATTGLPQADPRTIPPIIKAVPGTDIRNSLERAWGQTEWIKWHTEWEKQHPGQTPTNEDPVVALAAQLGHAFGVGMAQALREQEHNAAAKSRTSSAGEILARLKQLMPEVADLLEQYRDTLGPERMEDIFQACGDSIARLLIMLDPFRDPNPAKRIERFRNTQI